MERDRDRRAHQNFKNRALSRISELEAKVGSLSTELEMCINNTSSPHHHHLHPDSKSEPFTEDLMSEDEAIQILELTASKNRILEQEIQRLTEKVNACLDLSYRISKHCSWASLYCNQCQCRTRMCERTRL